MSKFNSKDGNSGTDKSTDAKSLDNLLEEGNIPKGLGNPHNQGDIPKASHSKDNLNLTLDDLLVVKQEPLNLHESSGLFGKIKFAYKTAREIFSNWRGVVAGSLGLVSAIAPFYATYSIFETLSYETFVTLKTFFNYFSLTYFEAKKKLGQKIFDKQTIGSAVAGFSIPFLIYAEKLGIPLTSTHTIFADPISILEGMGFSYLGDSLSYTFAILLTVKAIGLAREGIKLYQEPVASLKQLGSVLRRRPDKYLEYEEQDAKIVNDLHQRIQDKYGNKFYEVFEKLIGNRIFLLDIFLKLSRYWGTDEGLAGTLVSINRAVKTLDEDEILDYLSSMSTVDEYNLDLIMEISKQLQSRGFPSHNIYGRHAAWLFVISQDQNPEDYIGHELSSEGATRLRDHVRLHYKEFILSKKRGIEQARLDIEEANLYSRILNGVKVTERRSSIIRTETTLRIQKYLGYVYDEVRDEGKFVIQTEPTWIGGLAFSRISPYSERLIEEFIYDVYRNDLEMDAFSGEYDPKRSVDKVKQRIRERPYSDRIPREVLDDFFSEYEGLAELLRLPLARFTDSHLLNWVIVYDGEGIDEAWWPLKADLDLVRIDISHNEPKTIAHEFANFYIMAGGLRVPNRSGPPKRLVEIFSESSRQKGFEMSEAEEYKMRDVIHRGVFVASIERAISLGALYEESDLVDIMELRKRMYDNSLMTLRFLEITMERKYEGIRNMLEYIKREEVGENLMD